MNICNRYGLDESPFYVTLSCQFHLNSGKHNWISHSYEICSSIPLSANSVHQSSDMLVRHADQNSGNIGVNLYPEKYIAI